MALTNHIVSDSPTNNFATLNPLSTAGSTATPITISDGNLKTTHNVTGQWQGAKGTISVSSGIWYFEVVILQVPTGDHENYNIGFYNADIHNSLYYGLAGNLTFGANASVAQLYVNTSFTSYGSLGSNGSIYMFCLDVDSEKFWVGLNGSWFASGNPSTGVNPSASGFGKANWTTVQSDYTYSGAGSFQHNYGQDPTFAGNKSPSTTYTDANGIGAFYYPPPTDALALCTANLPDFTPTVIDDTPQDYFKTVIWTGQTNTGAYNNGNVTVGFRPDLVWIKARETGYAQLFNDSLRGTGVELRGNETGDQIARSDGFTAFNTTGFSVGTNAAYNDSAKGMVAWCWKAGGAPTADYASGNDTTANGCFYKDGSAVTTSNAFSGSYTITPTRASIGTKQGFSIIKYSSVSATPKPTILPHGLGKKPEFIITKCLDTSTTSWVTVQTILDSDFYLNEADAKFQTSGTYFQITADANTITFAKTDSTYSNNGTRVYIVYAFTSIEGLSKFGSYTGNGSPDGPFVYCGFRPAFILFKSADIASNWEIYDTARQPHNPALKPLYANLSLAEEPHATLPALDILSNGFKPRSNWDEFNRSGLNYIFMAFSEQPFKFSNAR